jgi:hypothetical protein
LTGRINVSFWKKLFGVEESPQGDMAERPELPSSIYDPEDPVVAAIRLYQSGRIEEAKGKIWIAYLEWTSGGKTLSLNQNDLRRLGITAGEYADLIKQSGIPIV